MLSLHGTPRNVTAIADMSSRFETGGGESAMLTASVTIRQSGSQLAGLLSTTSSDKRTTTSKGTCAP